MNNQEIVDAWQSEILSECRRKLGRQLTAIESAFVTSPGGFIALEMIHDTVRALDGQELVDYLNSETHKT